MSNISEIPKEAVQIRKAYLFNNINEWFCPDCDAKGNYQNVDFVTLNERSDPPYVEYCCSQCFETNIYLTFIED